VPYPLTQPRLRDWLIFSLPFIYCHSFFLFFITRMRVIPRKKVFLFWDFFAYLSVALSDSGKSTTP